MQQDTKSKTSYGVLGGVVTAAETQNMIRYKWYALMHLLLIENATQPCILAPYFFLVRIATTGYLPLATALFAPTPTVAG